MSDVNEVFKAKLLAVVTEYMFNERDSDLLLAKRVYNSINNAFMSDDGQVMAEMQNISASTYIKATANIKKNPASLSGQIEAKINDVIDIVNDGRRVRATGQKGKRINWEAAASEAYNRLNIRTLEGNKPTPRQFADAFNHLMANRKPKAEGG